VPSIQVRGLSQTRFYRKLGRPADGFRRWILAGIDTIDKSEGLTFLVDGPDPSVASCKFICSNVTPVRTAVAQ
jgi:hypothetical protein